MGREPQSAKAPLPARLVRPLEDFVSTEAVGGVLLLAGAAIALVWANLPGDSYTTFWSRHIGTDLGWVNLDLSLEHWVNDALMALFFFVVGLEIKREVLQGELADPKRAALPVAAALGGMIVPAAIYLSLNVGGEGERGWGIPMATDIAFAVGVLALVGPRVPTSLNVFLLALAIADDMGAIAVIAMFYTDDLDLAWLGVAAGLLGLTLVLLRAGVRTPLAYAPLAVAVWIAVYESGVHATVAGVALAMLVPIGEIGTAGSRPQATEQAVHDEGTLNRLEHTLHPWSSYVVLPIFALANAGIELSGGAISDAASSRVTAGVMAGLMIGKPVGVLLFSWIAVRIGVAALPEAVRWAQIAAAGLLAGIGFTVSIFIANLAFKNEQLIEEAKIGVLAASVIMAVVGLVVLRALTKPDPVAEEAAT